MSSDNLASLFLSQLACESKNSNEACFINKIVGFTVKVSPVPSFSVQGKIAVWPQDFMHLSISTPHPRGSPYTYWRFDIYTCPNPGAFDSGSLLNQKLF